jgi:hypothetical protein
LVIRSVSVPFKSTAPLWGLLALVASPAFAQTPSAASFPASLDESGLRTWLTAQTDMPATAVVSIGSNSVIGLRQVIGDPAGPGRFQIQIRAEVVNQRTATQGGYLSWAADLAIDCVQRRTRALGITNYTSRNLKGDSRVVGGPAADWVTPAAGTQLYSLLSAVCDHTFRRPLDQQTASAPAAPAPAPARPAVVAAQTTPPPALPRPAPAPTAAPGPAPVSMSKTPPVAPTTPAPAPSAPRPTPPNSMSIAAASPQPAAPSTPAPAPVAPRPTPPTSLSIAAAPPAPAASRPPQPVAVNDDEPAATAPAPVSPAPLPPPPAPPRAEPPRVQVAVAAPPVQATQPSPGPAAPTFAPPPPQPAPPPAPRRPLSRAAVQVGAGGSEAEARGLAARAKRNAPGGAGLSVTVARVSVNGRTVYRALLHGFSAKGEATAACQAIKSRGQDCFVRDSY